MPLELVREREHLAACLAGVASYIAAAVCCCCCLAVDGGAVVPEMVGLRERPVAQLAREGFGAVGQLVLLEGSQLGERFAALSALVRPLARVRPRVNPHSGGVAEHFP